MEQYIDILCDAVSIIPKNVIIHRLTGDGDKKILVAPLWSGNKKVVLNTINIHTNIHMLNLFFNSIVPPL